MQEDFLNNLREALKVSPQNIVLRLTLAEALMSANAIQEAETHYRVVLETQADNIQAKTGLAKIYFEQQKYSTAIVILEEIIETKSNDVSLLMLLSKALLRNNENDKSALYYKQALQLNPSLTDDELDQQLRKPSAQQQDVEDILGFIEEEINGMERPNINFDDVGGMQKVKDEIKIKIIQPLLHPELYKAYGKKIGGGILLYGPPGCGKTHLARATAGQINASFISVGIHDVLDMWSGQSERKLHELFELARRQTPCVLFFDEIDALGASRSDMRHSSTKTLINQFLTEMDGIDSSNDGVLVLGATNAPWHLDAAFRRPGRFDRIIFVQPPDQEGRDAILKIQLKDKPVGNIDYTTLAKQATDFSGADLKAVIDITIEDKLRESFEKGAPQPIQTKDLLAALKQVKPSTKEWFTTARNYALYANESGLYDEILDYLKIKKMISAQLERARQLITQQRYSDAEKELRFILSQMPNNTEALALLSICYSEDKKITEALSVIQQAIAQEPDNDYLLFLLSTYQFKNDQLKEAEKTVRNAIAFAPDNANYFGLLAAIKFSQKEWTEALESANHGLANDPDNLQCLNIRSSALFKLDKKEEAYSTIQEALSKDPENELTHANLGWGMLERGDHKKALEHFRESLKINPNFDYAKAGLVEGLKARYWFYRIFLKYAFWMSNFKNKGQWIVVIGLYIGIRVLGKIANENPSLAVFLTPIIYLYIAFAISTWIIGPLSNLFLRLNVYGRYALKKDEITSSNFVGIAFVLSLLGFGSYLLLESFVFLLLGIVGLGMMIACASMFNPPKQSSRNILIGYTVVLGLAGVGAIFMQATTGDASILLPVFAFGTIAYQWIANALIMR